MTYNFAYVPQGFFFCSSVFDSGNIVFGFYSVTDQRVIASNTSGLGLSGIFGRLMENVLRAIGLVASPDSLHWERLSALDLAQGIAPEYIAGQAINDRALLYLASVALSRLPYPPLAAPRTLCESGGGVRGPVQYRISNATPSRLSIADRSNSLQEVTSSGCHDVALLTGILNALYPNFVQPADDIVTGAAFENLPNVSSWSTYGEVSVPLFTAPVRAKEHSDGEAEDIVATCWLGRTAWNWTTSKWYTSSQWFATTTVCALALLAQVHTQDPFPIWSEFTDIRTLLSAVRQTVTTVNQNTIGLADGLVTIRDLVNNLTSICGDQFVILQEKGNDLGAQIHDVYLRDGEIQSTLDQVQSKTELIRESLSHVAADVAEGRLVQSADHAKIVTIENGVSAMRSQVAQQVDAIFALGRAQRLDDSVIATLVLKLALAKIKRKQRAHFVDKLKNLQYVETPNAQFAGDASGVVGLFDTFFTQDGSLVSDSDN